ncbi:MAG: hypothetical protein KGI97_07180, partial [Alphaproteobacteria bacterium]|nr:hypothetical protein [Alphaproteobacteria bacterium]
MKRALPYAVFAFFVASFALNAQSPLFTHRLADPDDYMRLNEVANWMRGQSWYDLSMPRLSPGAHTVVHWARLLDLPIALAALPFIKSYGLVNALLTASFFVPLAYFALLLWLLSALSAPVAGDDNAPLSVPLVLFAPILLFNYTPGRVDHHGVQALIAGFGLLSLSNIILEKNGASFAILAALGFACGFWIGAEALLWAIIFIACLAVAAAWQGGKVARAAALFGIALSAFTTLLIPIALPAAQFSSRALSWFSPAYIVFAALSGMIFVLGLAARNASRGWRLALYAALGLGAAAAFFTLIPSAVQGPFANYDAFDATTMLASIGEAIPLSHAFHVNRFMPATFIPAAITFFRLLFLPLAALIAALFAARKASSA